MKDLNYCIDKTQICVTPVHVGVEPHLLPIVPEVEVHKFEWRRHVDGGRDSVDLDVVVVDGGIVVCGSVLDTGSVHNTGSVLETGSVHDTGSVLDTGSVHDTGSVLETGSVLDTSIVDRGDVGVGSKRWSVLWKTNWWLQVHLLVVVEVSLVKVSSVKERERVSRLDITVSLDLITDF